MGWLSGNYDCFPFCGIGDQRCDSCFFRLVHEPSLDRGNQNLWGRGVWVSLNFYCHCTKGTSILGYRKVHPTILCAPLHHSCTSSLKRNNGTIDVCLCFHVCRLPPPTDVGVHLLAFHPNQFVSILNRGIQKGIERSQMVTSSPCPVSCVSFIGFAFDNSMHKVQALG